MTRLSLALALGLLPLTAAAQVPLTGTPVLQDFDSLAASGTGSTVPTGWAFRETGGATGTAYTASDGTLNSGDTYSAGATASTERAFGALASNTVTRIDLGGRYVNQTGSTISALTVQYRGELWRLGAASRNDRLDFQYSLDATALDNGTWVDVDALDLLTPNPAAAVGAVNGNDPANQTALTHTISGLAIGVGQTVFLRWVDGNITGSDDLLAIDDVIVGTGGGTVDLPPAVTGTTPANSATGVATNIVLAVQFSEAVTTAADWLSLSCSQSGNVAGTTGGTGASRSYTPATALRPGETCTATVRAASVTDLDGTPDPMAADLVFGFTIAPDVPPTVQSTSPTNGATGVALASNLVVRFSEPVAFPGASTARFAVLNGTTSVAINGVNVDGAGTSVTLSLASAIASTSQVKVSYSDPTTANDATGALEDLAGNDLASRSATAVPLYLASTSVTMASGFHSGYKGVELTAAAGNASLTGNASANDLTGNGFNNVLSGGGGADALTGGAGADEFLYASNSDSLLGTSTAPRYDRIRDLAIGTDTITMATAFAAPAGSISHRGTASALSEAAIATLLPTTTFAAGTAAAFSLGSGATTRSFLVLNDAVAGYQAATDGLIEITGFSGNIGALAIL